VRSEDPLILAIEIVDELHLSEKTREHSLDILKRAKKANLWSGKSAYGLAAAAVYIAANSNNERVTQPEITRFLGITDQLLRVTVKRFRDAGVVNFDTKILLGWRKYDEDGNIAPPPKKKPEAILREKLAKIKSLVNAGLKDTIRASYYLQDIKEILEEAEEKDE